MQSSGIETTLVATAANVDEYVENEAVEIPFDLDIEVNLYCSYLLVCPSFCLNDKIIYLK